MPPIGDPEVERKYRAALSLWNCDGYIVWKPGLETRLSECLPDHTQVSVGEEMHRYVEAGGKIDQQPETREPWNEHFDYHYDLRVPIGGTTVYIETVFPDWEPDPSILVVNIHDA